MVLLRLVPGGTGGVAAGAGGVVVGPGRREAREEGVVAPESGRSISVGLGPRCAVGQVHSALPPGPVLQGGSDARSVSLVAVRPLLLRSNCSACSRQGVTSTGQGSL